MISPKLNDSDQRRLSPSSSVIMRDAAFPSISFQAGLKAVEIIHSTLHYFISVYRTIHINRKIPFSMFLLWFPLHSLLCSLIPRRISWWRTFHPLVHLVSKRGFHSYSCKLVHMGCGRHLFPGNQNHKSECFFNRLTASMHNKQLHHGKLLLPQMDKNGSYRTPSGGTAISIPKNLGSQFNVKDDQSWEWEFLWNTTRCAASWIQVLPRTRALCISFYGYTACSVDDHHK